jgi:hypothetical protein
VTTRQRRRRLERRGRPRKENARRRATTLAGRRAPDDLGTEQLRRRKVRATSRPDLEISGAGVLLGRDLIDIEQYTVLMTVPMWLERLMRGWGGLGGVTGLWHSITGAAVPTGFVRPPNDVSSGLADGARRQLVRALRQLDGSRSLVVALAENEIPPLVLHVLDGQITPTDQVGLDRLRWGLDALAGRRTRQARDIPR